MSVVPQSKFLAFPLIPLFLSHDAPMAPRRPAPEGSMPPPSRPHTPDELDEVSRRIMPLHMLVLDGFQTPFFDSVDELQQHVRFDITELDIWPSFRFMQGINVQDILKLKVTHICS